MATSEAAEDRIELKDGQVRMVQLRWTSEKDQDRGIETYWRAPSGLVSWRSQGRTPQGNLGPLYFKIDELTPGLREMFTLEGADPESLQQRFPGYAVGQLGG